MRLNFTIKMNRLASHSIVIASLLIASFAVTAVPITQTQTSASSNTVSAPQLSGIVYSQSSLELFWNRDSNPNVTYNVFRDNVPLVTGTSATSFFDSGLSAGTDYVYGVSIDINGNTVAAAATTLTTRGTPTPQSNAPKFAGAERYSNSAVEISWVRTPNTFTAFYELKRNGELIDSQLDALSYYDNTAFSDQDWTYELVAIDREGNRSDIASITIDADGDTPEPPQVEPPVQPPIEPPSEVTATSITGTVYSPTSLEIFWTDTGNSTTRYIVFRDNVPVLTNTNALRFFDDGLTPGTSYVYGVSISRPNGDVLAASSRTFTTTPVEGVQPEPKDRPLFSGASRYSFSTVELFWVRTPGEFTAYYELRRNGEIIAERLDALSYYDNRVNANQTWTYTLFSVDQNGKRSEASTIVIEPGFTSNL